jgi:hypothetical protein
VDTVPDPLLFEKYGSTGSRTRTSGSAASNSPLDHRGGLLKVKVKVTLRLTVSQSLCLGVEPKYGTFDQSFIFFESYSLVIFGAPSLTRGQVCHVSVLSMKSTVVCHFYKIFTLQFTMLNIFTKVVKYVQYIQASFSPGFVQQIMPYLLLT